MFEEAFRGVLCTLSRLAVCRRYNHLWRPTRHWGRGVLPSWSPWEGLAIFLLVMETSRSGARALRRTCRCDMKGDCHTKTAYADEYRMSSTKYTTGCILVFRCRPPYPAAGRASSRRLCLRLDLPPRPSPLTQRQLDWSTARCCSMRIVEGIVDHPRGDSFKTVPDIEVSPAPSLLGSESKIGNRERAATWLQVITMLYCKVMNALGGSCWPYYLRVYMRWIKL